MRRIAAEAGLVARALLGWRMVPAVAASILLVVSVAIGIASGEPDWATALGALAVAAMGAFFGVRGGVIAACLASAGFLGWAIADDGFDSGDILNHRHLIYFAVGLLTGYLIYGLLGEYHLSRAVLRTKLRHAIRHGQVVVYYQPVADAESGKVVSLEALARWEHPERGTLMPADFVSAAEADKETIWDLTVHTLRLAIGECGRWREQGYEVGVAVNLSVATLDHPGLIEEISRLLREAGLTQEQLTLELTESAVMRSPELGPALKRMREAQSGTIAIDDFGTGYSSLARLEELPVDSLKIDQAFTRHYDQERGRTMLRSIIDLAHRLDLTACAEGVEDRAAWDLLIELGCDTVQGFALGYPMPAEEVPAWLDRTGRQGAARPSTQ